MSDTAYMTQRQVAQYIAHKLQVAERVVYERWVHMPNFPKGIALPSTGGRPRRRWVQGEIIAWTDSQRRAA